MVVSKRSFYRSSFMIALAFRQNLHCEMMQAAKPTLRKALKYGHSREAVTARAFTCSHRCYAEPGPSKPSLANDTETHFGFRNVPESIKESLVGNVFSSVASSYDVMVRKGFPGISLIDRFLNDLEIE